MDGFRENLDGFYDVENQLPRYLRERAAEYFEAERTRKARIDTVGAHERRVERVRESFLEEIGGLPTDRTPLNAETTGVLDRNGYAIERIVYESLPDFHVTGNFYRPDGDGPFPAVLFLCGHALSAKSSPGYQRACIELARNGIAAFAIDPIGQGERVQSYDPETGEAPRANTREHTYLAQQCLVAGANLARYFLRDMIRGLDYLEGRADVDDERLGATGNSGGGMQTGYLALIDDRLAAAAPCCFVTSREAYMKTGQAQDGEQIVHRAIERGPNYDDFVTAFAPKPMLIGAAQSDFLCIEGCRRTFERAREVYELYDRSERVDLVVADDTHGLSAPLREAMVDWFREHLRGVDPTFETGDPAPETGDLPTEDEETLACTATGQVVAEYDDETRVVDLNREYVRDRFDDAGRVPSVADHDAYAERTREAVVDRLDLDRGRHELHPRRIETEVDDAAGVRWEKVFFYSEPGVIVAGILAEALDAPETSLPTVVLPDRGTDEFDDHEERIAALARERGIAMAFDPRGVGAVRARAVNTPLANGGEYFDYHGTEYKLASDAIMMGTSLFGMRVYDVLRSREYLDRRDDANAFGIVGEGVGALHALYAAVVDDRFRTVSAESVPTTFYDLATTADFDIDFRLNVHGLVGRCDVPHLVAALEDRTLQVDGIDLDRTRPS